MTSPTPDALDLVKRLVGASRWCGGELVHIDNMLTAQDSRDLFSEAATAIQSLTAEVARLREGLRPFASAATDLMDGARDNHDIWESPAGMSITVGDLRRAKELYDSTPAQPETGIREAAQWQSMETAPKNGELVDLLFPYPRGRTINCAWSKNFGWNWLTPHWQDGELQPRDKWCINTYPNMEPYAWMYAPEEPLENALKPRQHTGEE